ncbi:SOS response-associated peptidase [Pedobacter sp. SYP-B3415]|uniref:SOS response-associated peptidase n=1 Tax=Pedobacter sp. SYP-B3415 TaxID=2496641 RepID=UPI0021078A86|nr:SOS response-associated peptidase [Pedobacter sp. SYP-B3415]
MCYHAQQKSALKKLQNEVRRGIVSPEEYRSYFHANGFDAPKMATVANIGGVDAIHMIRWGYNDNLGYNTLNARSEDVFEKRSFKQAIFEGRCIVPLTGFFEPHEHLKKKFPYFVKPVNTDFFMVGGIFRAYDSGEFGLSILTTAPNPLMARVHNQAQRMPLILPYERMEDWLTPKLDKEQIRKLMVPLPEEFMTAHPVRKEVLNNHVNTDVEDVDEPVAYQELNAQQTSLF